MSITTTRLRRSVGIGWRKTLFQSWVSAMYIQDPHGHVLSVIASRRCVVKLSWPIPAAGRRGLAARLRIARPH